MDYSKLHAHIMQPKFHVRFSSNGVEMQSFHRATYIPQHPARRGTVKGFSLASARRMRHMLFKPDYSNCVAVTLTRSSGYWDFADWRTPEDAFELLQTYRCRMPFIKSLIWRKEVQCNGTPHYHCILFPADGWEPRLAAEMLVTSWIDTLYSGYRLHDAGSDEQWQRTIEQDKDKARRAHHDNKRPSIQTFHDSTGYVRYLLDHQSKHKREQAKTVGRVWGVWNRAGLPLDRSFTSGVSESEWWSLGRVLRKVARYALPASDAPFGYVHSSGRRLQSHGDTVYFGRTIDGRLGRDLKRYLDMIRNS